MRYSLDPIPSDPSHPNQHSLVLDHHDNPNHPAVLIPQLCRQFYHLGWVTGTGGGISLRDGDHVYLAPSGVQKERITPQDLFVLSLSLSTPSPSSSPSESSDTQPQPRRTFLRWPVHQPLKQSACTPLFYNAYELRNAGACIHTHSQHAVLATLLWKGNEFRISHQEMIKGMRKGGTGAQPLSYLDTLVIPIIENTPDEEDLREGMEEAMRKYPDAPAILVRRHGTYSWGADWQKAKTQAECLDYLLEVAVKMRLAGLECEGL